MKYTKLDPFWGDYAQVAIGEIGIGSAKWGLINRSGEEVIPTIYDYMHYLGGDNVVVGIGQYEDIDNLEYTEGLYGVVTVHNEIVIPLLKYSALYPLDCNIKHIHAEDAVTGKHGIIDLNNNVIIPFEYNLISPVQDNLLLIMVDDEKWGMIDMNNKIIIEPIYDNITKEYYRANNPTPWLVVEKGTAKYYIDYNGNRVLF